MHLIKLEARKRFFSDYIGNYAQFPGAGQPRGIAPTKRYIYQERKSSICCNFSGVSPSKLKGTHDNTNHQVTEAEVAFPIKRN